MGRILTLADALGLTDDARIVTRSQPPYSIVHTNRAWCEITGYKFTEVVGNTCSFLQGKATVGPALKALHKALEAQKPCHQVLLNYRRDGTPSATRSSASWSRAACSSRAPCTGRSSRTGASRL